MKSIIIITLIILSPLFLCGQITDSKDSIVKSSLINLDSLMFKYNFILIKSKPFYFDEVKKIKKLLNIDLLKNAIKCENYYIVEKNKESSGFNSTKIIIYSDKKTPVIQFNKIKKKISESYISYNFKCFISTKGVFFFVFDNMLVLTRFHDIRPFMIKEGLKNVKFEEDKIKRK